MKKVNVKALVFPFCVCTLSGIQFVPHDAECYFMWHFHNCFHSQRGFQFKMRRTCKGQAMVTRLKRCSSTSACSRVNVVLVFSTLHSALIAAWCVYSLSWFNNFFLTMFFTFRKWHVLLLFHYENWRLLCCIQHSLARRKVLIWFSFILQKSFNGI